MKRLLTLTFILAVSPLPALSQTAATTVPSNGTTIVYRQVMPDGRVIYSDTLTKGIKVERVLVFPNAAQQTAQKPVDNQRMRGGNPRPTPASGASGR